MLTARENVAFNPHAINEDAIKPLSEYCSKRNWNCKECGYSIDRITKEHSPSATCIFANCPCDWKVTS